MAAPPPTTPLALEGTWTFERLIVDHLVGEVRIVTGTTDLVTDESGRVRWSESGIMSWGGNDVAVSRVLYIEPRAEGWFVTFEDGRDFHPWSPGTEVEHPCGADTYVGSIDAQAEEEDRWTVRWQVTGPAKNYTMATTLSRHTQTATQ